MAYWMFRVNEDDEIIGGGDSGSMSQAIFVDDWDNIKNCKVQIENNARPRLDVVMRVGTSGSRSFASQDYWTTTKIVEILSEKEDEVRFLTLSGSTYLWKC